MLIALGFAFVIIAVFINKKFEDNDIVAIIGLTDISCLFFLIAALIIPLSWSWLIGLGIFFILVNLYAIWCIAGEVKIFKHDNVDTLSKEYNRHLTVTSNYIKEANSNTNITGKKRLQKYYQLIVSKIDNRKNTSEYLTTGEILSIIFNPSYITTKRYYELER